MKFTEVPLTLDVVLGSTTIKVKDLEKINTNSVFELDKIVGSDADVRINGKKVAEGVIVVVNEHFGIRILKVCA